MITAAKISESMPELVRLWKAYEKAQAASLRAAAARHRLSPGGTRARVTSANADWARKAEHRDRCGEQLEAALARLVGGGK